MEELFRDSFRMKGIRREGRCEGNPENSGEGDGEGAAYRKKRKNSPFLRTSGQSGPVPEKRRPDLRRHLFPDEGSS
jgi:hypothetical protein